MRQSHVETMVTAPIRLLRRCSCVSALPCWASGKSDGALRQRDSSTSFHRQPHAVTFYFLIQSLPRYTQTFGSRGLISSDLA